MENIENLPKIVHDINTEGLENLITLPNAKFIETKGLQGISQLQAFRMEPIFTKIGEVNQFSSWQEIGDFQFKIMLSPNKTVIRMELYDPNIFPILLEQLLDKGYSVISSGEDVEFTQGNPSLGGWLGWAHLVKLTI